MRVLWFVCIALLLLAVFGDLADAKKYKGGDKKSKDVKTNGKTDGSVKHNKEKYLQEKQGKFEGKREKRETKQTDSSNVIQEEQNTNKASKRKCSKSGGCTKTNSETIPNKKHKNQEISPEQNQKPSKKVQQKEKYTKNKIEKLSKTDSHKKHGKKTEEELVQNDQPEQVIREEKSKPKHNKKVETEETTIEDKTKKQHKKSKRSVDQEEILEDPLTPELELEENERVEEESCDKKTEENDVQDVAEETEETNEDVQDKYENEEESSILETL